MNNIYKKDDILQIKFNNIIGEGAYGIVLGTSLNIAIKIYKDSQFPIKYEDSNKLLPTRNENREILFLSNILKNIPNNYPKNLILPIGIGYLNNSIQINMITYKKKSCIMLMNKYKSFFTIHKKLKSYCFINNKKTRFFILNLIIILLKISEYLEEEHKLVNLDFKIDNIMYYNNNIKIIDLGLVKKFETNMTLFIPKHKYYIWPDVPSYIYAVPIYSIAITALELLFGIEKFNILKKNEYINKLKLIDESLYNIINNMLLLKFNSKYILSLIDQEYILNKLKNKNIKKNNWFTNLLITLFKKNSYNKK